MKTIWKVLLLVLFVAAAVGLGFLLDYIINKKEETKPEEKPKPTSTSSPGTAIESPTYKTEMYSILLNNFKDYKFDTVETRNKVTQYIKVRIRTMDEPGYDEGMYKLRNMYLNKMDDFSTLSDYSIYKYATYWEAIAVIYFKRIFWDDPDFISFDKYYNTFQKLDTWRPKVEELATKFLNATGSTVKAANLSDLDLYNLVLVVS